MRICMISQAWSRFNWHRRLARVEKEIDQVLVKWWCCVISCIADGSLAQKLSSLTWVCSLLAFRDCRRDTCSLWTFFLFSIRVFCVWVWACHGWYLAEHFFVCIQCHGNMLLLAVYLLVSLSHFIQAIGWNILVARPGRELLQNILNVEFSRCQRLASRMLALASLFLLYLCILVALIIKLSCELFQCYLAILNYIWLSEFYLRVILLKLCV